MKSGQRAAGVFCLLPKRIDEQTVVAGDADRDLERRSSMLVARISGACQRLAIGRSAAGVPRTYRIVRSSPWTWRLAVLLRRLMP
jgi:hypothetical protein